jgi:hypothetical protein
MSVVIQVVDEFSVGLLKSVNQPPVPVHGDCKETAQVALQGMPSPAWRVHVFRSLGKLQSRQLAAKPLGMRGLNTCLASRGEERFESLVPEAADHARM